MTLETTLSLVLAEYRAHVRKWRRCYRRAFPHLPADFGIDDVSDDDIELYDDLCDSRAYEAEQLLNVLMFRIEIELMLPSTDAAKGPNHKE